MLDGPEMSLDQWTRALEVRASYGTIDYWLEVLTALKSKGETHVPLLMYERHELSDWMRDWDELPEHGLVEYPRMLWEQLVHLWFDEWDTSVNPTEWLEDNGRRLLADYLTESYDG